LSFEFGGFGIPCGVSLASSVEPLVFSTTGRSIDLIDLHSPVLSSFFTAGTSSFLGASSTCFDTMLSPALSSLGSSGFDCVPSPGFPTGMKFDLTRVLNPLPPKGDPVSFCSGFTNALPCCSKKALSEETCSSPSAALKGGPRWRSHGFCFCLVWKTHSRKWPWSGLSMYVRDGMRQVGMRGYWCPARASRTSPASEREMNWSATIAFQGLKYLGLLHI